MKISQVAIVLVALLGCVATAEAQLHRREPLTAAEIDQLRDTAMEPYERLKLFSRFARARLSSLEEMRNDPKAPDRGQQTHDQLQQFADIYDELNENIDNFIDRKEDMRKTLKSVIEADNEFQAKLVAFKSTLDSAPTQAEQYRFLLENTLEAVGTGAEDHQKLLAEQEEAAKHRRKSKAN